MNTRSIRLLFGLGMLALAASARGANQTPDTSPIVVGGLPYEIILSVHDMGALAMPGLQTYAAGTVGDNWVIVAGRTNGLHGFSFDGLANFPPQYQNTDVWVINPVTQQAWSRSLNDPTAGLTVPEVAALSATATQYVQSDSTLYVSGGYVFSAGNFTTYDTLTALDLPGVVDWVQTGNGTLAQHLRQTSDPALKVTGGDLHLINGRALLVFGQDFEGPYTPFSSGNYTRSVLTFDIVDNGVTLGIANLSASTPLPEYRRRDLNVVPVLSDTGGNLTHSLVALSGVFTETGGAWTVPVEITANGTPSMADPSLPGTFKQGMNNYNSAFISLYSASADETHTVLPGGISYLTYVPQDGTFDEDPLLPFITQTTVIVRTADADYTQYLMLNGSFPWIPGPDDDELLFGAGARFFPAGGLPMMDGLIDLDSLTGSTLLGYIYGGIIADAPDFGNTTASGYIFEVYYSPVPEPAWSAVWLALAAGLVVWSARRVRRA